MCPAACRHIDLCQRFGGALADIGFASALLNYYIPFSLCFNRQLPSGYRADTPARGAKEYIRIIAFIGL
jgi:hypothetical protein